MFNSDSDSDENSRQWIVKHNEDILSLAAYDTSIIATSSYDGDIIIWSLETAQPLCRLNASDGVYPRTGSRTIYYGSKAAGSTNSADVTRLARRRSAESNTSSVSDVDNTDGVLEKHKAHSSKTLLNRTKDLVDPSETSKAIKDSADEPSYQRTSLPAIGTPKSSFVHTSPKQYDGVTESMSNIKQKTQSERTASSSRKSFYIDVEDSKEYTKKHESAVEKVSTMCISCLKRALLWPRLQSADCHLRFVVMKYTSQRDNHLFMNWIQSLEKVP